MSCAVRERRRTSRPKATSGSTMTGMAASTKPESRGLVTTIMAAEPKNSTMLRSAIDIEAPTAALICVVSAVSRDTSSPDLAVSKKSADSCVSARTPRGADRRRRARRSSSRGSSATRWRPRARPRPRSSRRNTGRSARPARPRSRGRSCAAPRSAPPASPARRPAARTQGAGDAALVAGHERHQPEQRPQLARDARRPRAAAAGSRLRRRYSPRSRSHHSSAGLLLASGRIDLARPDHASPEGLKQLPQPQGFGHAGRATGPAGS